MDEVIYLLRHGETRWNLERRIQGQLDSDLTEVGIEQARTMGRLLRRELAGADASAIESSPSGRAMATANIVAAEVGFDLAGIRTTPLLAERHMGRWAGLTLDEVEVAFPRADARNTIDDWAHTPADGETYEEMLGRARAWLALDRRMQVTIAVSHGLIGATIREAYLGTMSADVLHVRHPQDCVFRLRGGAIEELTG